MQGGACPFHLECSTTIAAQPMIAKLLPLIRGKSFVKGKSFVIMGADVA
jgi:hypothetical protein